MHSKTLRLLGFITALTILMSACAPQPIQQPTDTPTTVPSATTVVGGDASTPTLVSTDVPTLAAAPSPTLVPIDLGGPIMEVGATWPYVDGSVLVAVPAGSFIMGHGGDDNPEHTVTLSEFWIYRNEVTNKQYALCVAYGKCALPNLEMNPAYNDPLRVNEPVIGVNWDQADSYCKFVNGRLPTEAEWEKTARGPDGNTYPWGESAPNCDLANIGRCNIGVKTIDTYPDGRSYYSAMDMSGNVFEWVADWYSPSYYSLSPGENPTGPETGDRRSVRSTSFGSNFYEAEAARRWRELPVSQRSDLGFRCVIEDPAATAPWCQVVAIVNPNQSGGGPASQNVPSPSCPSVSVSTFGYCNSTPNGKVPAASVNFSPDVLPPGTLTTYPGGCSLDSTTADPNDYYCTGGGTASIQALCTVPPPPVPAGCAPGYTQNGNVCDYTGGLPGQQCVAGANYNALTQCCSAAPGVGDSYTLCPASAPYYAGGICQPWPVADYDSPDIKTVTLGSCSTGGDDPGGNNSCTGLNYDQCKLTSSCRWDGKSCVPITP
jgi:iron(II)-dependent oxidoreductase